MGGTNTETDQVKCHRRTSGSLHDCSKGLNVQISESESYSNPVVLNFVIAVNVSR